MFIFYGQSSPAPAVNSTFTFPLGFRHSFNHTPTNPKEAMKKHFSLIITLSALASAALSIGLAVTDIIYSGNIGTLIVAVILNAIGLLAIRASLKQF